MRLVFKSHIEYPTNTQFVAYRYEADGKVECDELGQRYIKVAPGVFDTACPMKVPIGRIDFSGSDVLSLCSLYVSVGRVLPLQQKRRISTTYKGWSKTVPLYREAGDIQTGRMCFGKTSAFKGVMSLHLPRGLRGSATRFYLGAEKLTARAGILTGYTLRTLQYGAETFKHDDLKGGANTHHYAWSLEMESIPLTEMEITSRHNPLELQFCLPNCSLSPTDVGCRHVCNCDTFDQACLRELKGCKKLCSPDADYRNECTHYCCNRRFRNFRLVERTPQHEVFPLFSERQCKEKSHRYRTILEALSDRIRELYTSIDVLVYGDSICPKNKWGRECDQTGQCAQMGEKCLVSTGYCVHDRAACNKPGWFGRDCRYQCHCRGGPDDSDCDGETGDCTPTGCQDQWFGPGCQYRSDITTEAEWLNDNNHSTCNPGRQTRITTRFLLPLHFTWMRLVFKSHIEYPNNTDFVAYRYEAAGKMRCEAIDERYVKVAPGVFDTACPMKVPIGRIDFFGSDVLSLCSLYVSVGRVLPLQQRRVSTTFKGWSKNVTLYREARDERSGFMCLGSTAPFSGVMSLVLRGGATRFFLGARRLTAHAGILTGYTLRTFNYGSETFKHDDIKGGLNSEHYTWSLEKESIPLTKVQITSHHSILELQYCLPNCSRYRTDPRCKITCNRGVIDQACLLDLKGCREVCSPYSNFRSPCQQYCCTGRFRNLRLVGLTPRHEVFPIFSERHLKDKSHRYRTILGALSDRIRELYTSIDVLVYGDSICSDNKWGRECGQTCRCKQLGEKCLVSTGHCVSGRGLAIQMDPVPEVPGSRKRANRLTFLPFILALASMSIAVMAIVVAVGKRFTGHRWEVQ